MWETIVVLERDTKVTEKGQTTVPKPVRDALRIRPGDHIRYRIDGETVSLHRVEDAQADDPALVAFLTFLAGDMTRNPQALSALSPDLAARIAGLVDGIAFDPDDPITGAVSL